MLILGRKVGEAFTIEPHHALDPNTPIGQLFAEGPITIWISRVRHGQVKVGVQAPRTLVIVRDELKR